MRPADVSVIVPVGGAAPAWECCARSLERLDPPPGEVVVVLDGKGPAAERHLETARRIGATLVELERKAGPAAARNRGVEAARGEVLFFLDSDVEAPPDLVARVARLFDTAPAEHGAGRGDRPGDGTDAEPAAVIGSYDDDPGNPGFLSQYRNLLHHHVHQTSHERASTFWSGCGAVRSRAFLEAGGFHEGYTDPSIEDIELGGRLRRAGHAIRLVKDLQVKHLKRWTFADMVHTDLFRRAIPWTEQMLSSGGLVNDLNVKTRDRFSVALAFLAPLPFAAALLEPLDAGPAIAAGLGTLALLVALNLGFFAFLGRVRGPWFAVRSVPMYWIYLVICGLGFGLGALRHLLRRRRAGHP